MFRLKTLRNTSVCEPLDDDVGKIHNHCLYHPKPCDVLPSANHMTTSSFGPPSRKNSQKKFRVSLSETITTAASNSELSLSLSSISTSSRSLLSSRSSTSSSSASRKSSSSPKSKRENNTSLLLNKMGTKQEKEILKLVKSLPDKARDDLAVQASSSLMKRSKSFNKGVTSKRVYDRFHWQVRYFIEQQQ